MPPASHLPPATTGIRQHYKSENSAGKKKLPQHLSKSTLQQTLKTQKSITIPIKTQLQQNEIQSIQLNKKKEPTFQ